MSGHPNALGLLDRAKRLIDESGQPDHSPLTTASRDIREARTAIAELIEAGELVAHERLGEGPAARWRNMQSFRAALARVGGGK
jgi:hypothetical protein